MAESAKHSAIDEWCAGRDWRWRAGLLALLVWQAARPLRDPEAWSVFRGITFGVHEFGHLFFSLFGNEWIAIAGGSGMQIIIPVGAMVVIGKTSGDWFGVTATGTWLAASLIDLAPYIADARAQELDLLSFSEEASGHDWHYLLAQAGMLKQDLAIARLDTFVAVLVLVGVIVSSLYLFSRMARLKGVAPEAATG
jgi:hypothetical protein